MISRPDFVIRHYLPDDGRDVSPSYPPLTTPSQEQVSEATVHYAERTSIDSTSTSRKNSIQGHLERLRRRTDFNISGELMISATEVHYEEAPPENPVWDWFALDNVFHRPTPSSRGDLKHLIRPLSPRALPDQNQMELERAARAYEDRLRPVEETKPTDATTNPARIHSSAPVPGPRPAKHELDKNGIPYFHPPLQSQSWPKRKRSGNAYQADGHKKARYNWPLSSSQGH